MNQLTEVPTRFMSRLNVVSTIMVDEYLRLNFGQPIYYDHAKEKWLKPLEKASTMNRVARFFDGLVRSTVCAAFHVRCDARTTLGSFVNVAPQSWWIRVVVKTAAAVGVAAMWLIVAAPAPGLRMIC